MKIKIDELEKNIGYKIKRNFKSIGFDCAATTGVVILKSDEENISVDYRVLSFKTKNFKEKYSSIVKIFEDIIHDDMYSVVEDTFVGLNPSGSIELTRIGSFALAESIKKGIEFELILAKSLRAKFKVDTKCFPNDKKNGVKRSVGLWVKNNTGIDFKDDNLNDAFLLSLSAMCIGFDFRSQEEIKKGK